MKSKFLMGVRFMCCVWLALAAMLPTPGKAAVGDYFGGPGTVLSTNICYYIVPACGGACAAVNFITAKSDSATNANLKFYQNPTVDILVTNSLAAGLSNILTSATNGLAQGDVIVIRRLSSDGSDSPTNYQKAIVNAVAASGIIITNDLTAATTSFPLVAGDHIYRYPTATTFPIGATTTTHNGSGGPVMIVQTYPAIIEVSCLSLQATTNQQVIVSGRFLK